MEEHTLTIRLQPGQTNRIKVSEGNGKKPLFGLYVEPEDKVIWTSKDQGNAPGIVRWLVSFIDNEWSGDPPEPAKPGTPLVDAYGNEVWRVSGAGSGPSVETWISSGRGDFQFAIAVLDEDGELYALDPEIRVRPGLRG